MASRISQQQYVVEQITNAGSFTSLGAGHAAGLDVSSGYVGACVHPIVYLLIFTVLKTR